uniref:GyrB_0 protein n=1 Tax=Fopius arisanus TaxID=64838 RepID=A0A0C9R8N7_9HYME
MNSKEKPTKPRNEMDLDMDEAPNDNRSPEGPRKPPKIQNGGDQHKLNNNLGEDSPRCSSKSPGISNGSPAETSSRFKPLTNANFSTTHSLPSSTSTSSGGHPHDDVDMRNNVDYVCGINKCPPKVSCSSSSSPEDYVSDGVLNNIGGCIGSTSQGTCGFLRPNINGSREIPGPSGLQPGLQRTHRERRDSSSGNEGDMSDEDYCIYTYKGNDQGDERDYRAPPGLGRAPDAQEVAGLPLSGPSSPEMDFLEMDFDPGPSCEQDTGDSDLASINEDIQNIAMDHAEDHIFLNDLSGGKVISKNTGGTETPRQEPNVSCEVENEMDMPSGSGTPGPQPSISVSGVRRLSTPGVQRNPGLPIRESYGYHNTSGDLISPGESRDADSELWADAAAVSLPENSALNSRKVNLSSTLYHRMMAKKLMLNKQTAFNQSGDSNLESELYNERLDGLLPVEKVMLWSEQEATVKQVTQIATSACGATSAVNVLLALDVPFSLEVLVKSIATRQREPGSPLPRYLVSRSQAGATHRDLIRGLSLATNGAVVSKFFAFYPERAISLSHWLHYWISRGAAPIATLNLQNYGTGTKIPDAWHHQMIFGVSQAGIYFTNPLECLPEQIVWHQLMSPSVLLIRRADVLAHWNPTTDLAKLAQMDHRWRRLNVLGQVVNMIRESMDQKRPPRFRTADPTHIRIPASYSAGITLVMRSEAPAAEELLNAEQLPLL